MSNKSAEGTHLSVWNSPVPYLLGGVGAMVVLIAFALIILSWSYFKECSTAFSEHPENIRSTGHHNLEHGDGGVSERKEDMSNLSEDKYEMKVIVIMAGDEKPSFIATPSTIVVREASNPREHVDFVEPSREIL